MKTLKLKVLAAALAALGASPTYAAVADSTSGNGDLFLSVWDSVSQTSYTRDLGNTISQFASGAAIPVLGGTLGVLAPGFSLTFTADSILTNWLGGLTNPSLRWNVGALDGSGNARYFSTASTTPVAPVFTDMVQFKSGSDVYLSNVNSGPWQTGSMPTGIATTGSVVISATDNPNGYAGSANWGSNYGGVPASVNLSTSAEVGESLFFWLFSSNNALETTGMQQFANANGASTWTFSDGTLTFMSPAASTIPLPGAVWLLGSGLLGLVTVARRKRA
jgi:hypothetical protein